MNYFFDTYAIIEIIKENKHYEKFLDEELLTSILNVGELYYALLRDFGKKTAKQWQEKLKQTVLSPNLDDIVKAMEFRFKNRGKNLSFIDCVSYVMAKENKMKFLTGDKEFEGMDNVEFVK